MKGLENGGKQLRRAMRLAGSKAKLVALIAGIEAKSDDVDCATNVCRVLANVHGEAEDNMFPLLADTVEKLVIAGT